MKILITGISGFLGRNIASTFINNGHIVYGISRKKNSFLSTNVNFIECDLKNNFKLIESIEYAMPDIIIHCAWNGGNSYLDVNSPTQFQNVIFTTNLMEIISKNRIPYFVGFGSASEYGNNHEIMCETNNESPINLYGTCKKMTKEYTKTFCANQNIKWAWVRPFYTYGYGDVSSRLIPKVIIACLKKTPLKLNSCEFYTDYLHINDLTSGVFNIINQQCDGIFNICYGVPQHIKTIIEFISKYTNYTDIEFNEKLDRPNTPLKIEGSNTKIRNTGWIPTISILTGLKKTIDEYEKNI